MIPITSPEMPTEDLNLPSDCRFQIWSRAELEVSGRHVTLEGRHAGLMLELLRNQGKRVPATTLWASMLASGMCEPNKSVHKDVAMEICRVRYRLAGQGILLSVDDSAPEEGFMLSSLCRITCDPPVKPGRRRSKTRRTQKVMSESGAERTSFKPGHSSVPVSVPYSAPERLEKKTVCGGEK
jgi:hypothetical protein